jgi:hypothetical protein
MKTILILLLLVSSFIGCQQTSSVVTPEQQPTSTGLIIRFDKFENNSGYRYLSFIVENNTDSTYYTIAYDRIRNESISPLYTMEALNGSTWENLFLGWCGTGASIYSILPGEKLHFTTHAPETVSTFLKTGIYASTDSTHYTSQLILSNEVKLK